MDPKYDVVLFACYKWGYSAADLTGTCRMKYDTGVRIIRIRCTGRVDISHIMHAIRAGADAVMIIGWHFGECDYKDGNIRANERIEFVKRILDKFELGSDRVNLYQCSAAEVNRFVAAVEDQINKLQKIGPNPIKITNV